MEGSWPFPGPGNSQLGSVLSSAREDLRSCGCTRRFLMLNDKAALHAMSGWGLVGRRTCRLQPCRSGLMGNISFFRAKKGRITRRAALGRGVRQKLTSSLHPAPGGPWGEWQAPHLEPFTHCVPRSGLCCQEENLLWLGSHCHGLGHHCLWKIPHYGFWEEWWERGSSLGASWLALTVAAVPKAGAWCRLWPSSRWPWWRRI